MNSNKKIVESIRITSELSTRISNWNQLRVVFREASTIGIAIENRW